MSERDLSIYARVLNSVDECHVVEDLPGDIQLGEVEREVFGVVPGEINRE